MRSAWWGKVVRSLGVTTKPKRPLWTYTRLRCEQLEDRHAPAAIIWEGDVSADWNNAGNWTGGVPTAADDVTIVAPGGTVVFQPTLNVNAVTQNLTINSGATLTGAAAFTLSISGNFANAGTFNAAGSAVFFNAAAGTQTLDSGTATFANLTHSGTTTLQLVNTNLTVGGALTNAAGAGDFQGNGLAITVTGLTIVTAADFIAGAGTHNLNGGLTINGGTFTGGAGIVNVTNVTLSVGVLAAPQQLNVSGDWSKTGGTLFTHNNGTVNFTGAGTQTLNSGGTGVNSRFNNITHSGTGLLQLSASDLSADGTLTNAAGAGNFDANGRTVTVTGLTTLTAGAYLAGAGTQSFNGALNITGTFTGAAGIVNVANVNLSTGGTLTAPATMNVSGNWTKTGGTFTHSSGTVNFTGAAAQTLNSGGTDAGSQFNHVTHSGAGTLQLITNNLTAAGTLTNSNGTIDINSRTVNVGGFVLTGGAVNDVAGGGSITSTSTYDVQAGSVGARLAGTGIALTKSTAGSVTLGGANTYTGATTINAGTLLVNGSLASGSTVAVNGTATLGGTGDINGAVNVNNTAHVAPGTSTGILETGSVVFAAGTAFDVEINGTTVGTQYDQLHSTGTVNLGGATLNLSGAYVPVKNDTFVIVTTDNANSITGTFAGLPQGANINFNGEKFKIDYNANGGRNVVLKYDGNATVPLVDNSGNNNFTVSLVANNVVVTMDGVTILTKNVNALETLTILGGAGNDTLTVDFTGGNPIPSGNIVFDGGLAGNDKLAVKGSRVGGVGGETAVYTPDALITGNGTIVVDGQTITFTGLEPVDIFGMASATLMMPAGNDTLTITNGFNLTAAAAAVGTIPALVVAGTTGDTAVGMGDGVVIETAAFFNNGTVTINTNTVSDGADQVTIVSANNAHANANLTISTGANADNLIVDGEVNVTGTFNANTPTVNLNNNLIAGTLTGSATNVNVNNNTTAQINDGIGIVGAGGSVNLAALIYTENVLANKSNFTLDGVGPTSIITPAAGIGISVTANNVTLRDLRVTGTAAGSDGIRVDGVNTVTLNNVTADANGDDGLDARNVSGGVTIIGGAFNANASHGIHLQDIGGLASLTGVTLSDNLLNGLHAADTLADADTLAVGSLLLSGVTVTETLAGFFQDVGISVGDVGTSVTFSDNTTTPNTITGNTAGGVVVGNVGGAVSITSANGATYSNNTGGDGIRIASLGGVLTVSGITASGNAGDGFDIGDGGTTASISSSTFANNTGGHGVHLNSTVGGFFTGGVTLTNVTATGNSVDGVHAENLRATTTVTGGTFDSNTDDGLDLDGNGAGTSLVMNADTGSTASTNGDDGLFATEFSSISLTGRTFNNNGATSATGEGVQITNSGTVTTNTLTVTGNDRGILLTASGSLSDTGSNVSNNRSDGITILDLLNRVTLTGTTINDNAGNGLHAIDTLADLDTNAVGGVTLSGVTITDTVASFTQQHGVSVGDSSSGITFNDNALVPNTITDNALSGVTIGNVTGDVSITSTHSARYSLNLGGDGIHIASLTGALNVSGIAANDNGGDGFEIGNGGTTAQIQSSTFSGNDAGSGINLNSDVGGDFSGDVSMTSVFANFNSADGIRVTGIANLDLFTINANNNAQEGLDLTLTGAQSDFVDVTLTNNNRGILFNGGGTVRIDNALIDNNELTGNGAGINNQNGILNLDSVIISNNTATGGQGGGIFNAAGATINFIDSGTSAANIVDNTALAGGGIFNVGTITQAAGNVLLIDGNEATSGAGVFVNNGAVSLNSARIRNNIATAFGGGLAIVAGDLTIANSIISGNTAMVNGGGGLVIAGTTNPAVLRNSTISGNLGNGIEVFGGTLDLTHATVAFNTGDGVRRTAGTVNALNSLFASNTALDFNGVLVSGGFNLFQNAAGTFGTAATDILNQHARLAPLGNYGGATPTHALLPGSFALNAVLVDAAGLAADQRGVARPTGAPQPAFKDIGAYESRGFTVTRVGDVLADVPPGDIAYRTLANNLFVDTDGETPLNFAVKVTANDPLLTVLTGGVVNFTAPPVGGATATTTAPQPIALTLNGADFTAQTTVRAGAVGSAPGTPYLLFAAVDPNDAALAAGDPNSTDWKLFNQIVSSVSYAASGFIAGASNAGPILITTTEAHLLVTGQRVVIQGVEGNTAANGVFTVTVVNATQFTLNGSAGNGTYTGGGIFVSTNDAPKPVGNIAFVPSADPNIVGELVVTTPVAHNLISGQQVIISGVGGISANGTFTIQVINNISFRLLLSTDNGVIHVPATGTYIATFGLSPQNTESGNNQFGGVRFKNANGDFTNRFYLTLLDQDGTPRPIVLDGQAIELRSIFDGVLGKISLITSAAGFLPADLINGIVIAQTENGIAGFANMRIFQSAFSARQVLEALVPAAVPNGFSHSSEFGVVPIAFKVEAGNFAGAGQTVFNVTLADSNRGQIRLLSIFSGTPGSGLGTNQIRIRATDFVAGTLPDPITNPASSYNGPVYLFFNVPVTIGLGPLIPANTPILFNMTNGELLLSNVVTTAAVPPEGFTVTADFTLVDEAGTAIVNFGITTTTFQATFIRANPGRQRGR
jgi:hypothetical protein